MLKQYRNYFRRKSGKIIGLTNEVFPVITGVYKNKGEL